MGLNAELIASKAKVNLLGFEDSIRNKGYTELGFWHRRHDIHRFLEELYNCKFTKGYLFSRYKYHDQDMIDCLLTFNCIFFKLEKDDLFLFREKIKNGFIRLDHDDDGYVMNEDISFIDSALEYLDNEYHIYYKPNF